MKALSMAPAAPVFVLGDNSSVRSYCRGAWGGLTQGVTRVDSTNRPNGLMRMGSLRLSAFHQALRILLRRHTVLNARLEERDGHPWICPCPDAELNVVVLDLGARRAPQERSEAEHAIGQIVWRPLDHAQGPLYRAYAVRAGEEFYMGLVVHHFVADAVSVNVLLRELSHLHDALARRQVTRLGPVALRYQDYLRGIDSWIASKEGSEARGAVLQGLAGAAAPQFENVAPPSEDDRQYFIFDSAVTATVRSVARQLGTSVFTVLLAAQNAIAAPWTAARSTTLKVITTGREVSSLMSVVGNMADRIYVATDVSRDPQFGELILRTHGAINRSRKLAFVRADFAQADMVGAGMSTAAPVFNFRSVRKPGSRGPVPANAPTAALCVPPAQVEGQITRPRDAYYLEIVDDGADLWGSIKYGQGRIGDFLVEMEAVLRAGCADPQVRLGQLLARAADGDPTRDGEWAAKRFAAG